MGAPANALSLDVEEWFHVYNLRDAVARDDWDGIPSRVEASTRTFLELLERRDAKATFFILGWIAERHPALVEAIAAAGHEVASHGYGHDLVSDLDPESFERDLERTEIILEGITGSRPVGYRAPSFTIMPGTLWALDVLHRRGYRYDSSVFPVKRGRYGHPSAPRQLHAARRGDDGHVLWCFPLLTRRLFGKNLPMAGGGYLRLFPAGWIASAVRKMNAEGWPAMVYLHPWELDPDQPLPGGLPLRRRFMHTVNLRRTAAKLDTLLGAFRFTTTVEALDATLEARPELRA